MNIKNRLGKLEATVHPPGNFCKCPKELMVIFPSDDAEGDLMTTRDIIAQREADKYCSDCGLEVCVIRVAHDMCECEKNLDLRIDIPDDWYTRPDSEHWRQYLIAKCDDCGESIHYARETPRVRAAR